MKKEIKSIMHTKNLGNIPYIYRDIDSVDEIKDIKINGVHAYCFCNGKLVVVWSDKKKYWTPPGGAVEVGETVEQAVTREVKEESNMEVVHHEIIGYIEVDEKTGKTIQTRSFCIVKPCGPFECDPDGDIDKIELINPEEYKKYFDWGEVGDYIMKKALEKFRKCLTNHY